MGESVPEQVLESVSETLIHVDHLRANMVQFMGACDADVLAYLPPLQRANVFLTLAKAVSSLYTLRLRCNGVHPDNHPVKTELERLSLYEDKIDRYKDWTRGPQRPSTTINYKAATRFIEHSLPDLAPEQRQSMREISREDGQRSQFEERRRGKRKRKSQVTEKQSVHAAAEEFLAKATRELLGDKDSLRGPLRDESSEEEKVSNG
ncbi:hypothetical protein AMTRI_Chr12g273440 [Amborella trichopoda]|uniref:Nuclear nucleic acid-binding protein C1D n=1 Tax=Amborella trichopoda TaxID=13333 RepID=W1PGE2_AMBTC|nr:uncharacterized protein LOC18435268 [Amborella trichopoda]XP_020523594.1 uncharacterized protein LOC18435268 [Amborella trichopoda]ERN07053.1 hypothetical protein AMTR_s00019p00040900 [Amborella trichopoda]|eukprot:XP_006845378.1 uncharacterized protein LOC18435268 [Amborella trichopoda]